MDLHFNTAARFTRWIAGEGLLETPFVVLDVGVQGGENPRWHLLGDYLVVHGLDAIEEVVAGLRAQQKASTTRNYHWLAAGSADEERVFFFNGADPCSSSFFPQGSNRVDAEGSRSEQARHVSVRRLDTLLAERVISPPDFLKVDVEGFERDVLLGAEETLKSVLGVEIESNFNVSPSYPKTHFATIQELLLRRHLLVFDINFNRRPRAAFQEALARRNFAVAPDLEGIGKPATLNVLFCRDLVDEVDFPLKYQTAPEPIGIDQLLKMSIIYELHGLNDIAIDTISRFRDLLAPRIDIEKAIDLLADPFCRVPGGEESFVRQAAEIAARKRHVELLERQVDAVRNSPFYRLLKPILRAGRRFTGG
jgi:FkbM family methyltransferase